MLTRTAISVSTTRSSIRVKPRRNPLDLNMVIPPSGAILQRRIGNDEETTVRSSQSATRKSTGRTRRRDAPPGLLLFLPQSHATANGPVPAGGGPHPREYGPQPRLGIRGPAIPQAYQAHNPVKKKWKSHLIPERWNSDSAAGRPCP